MWNHRSNAHVAERQKQGEKRNWYSEEQSGFVCGVHAHKSLVIEQSQRETVNARKIKISVLFTTESLALEGWPMNT